MRKRSARRRPARLVLALALAAPLAASASDAGARALLPLPGQGPVFAAPPLASHGSGAFFVGYRGTDGQTTGAIAAFSPWRSAFLRLGAEVMADSNRGSARFLWGLGWEDPRDGTFFAHLHDWELVAGESFTFRNAEASVGYKLPRLCAGPLCLAEAIFATTPLSGGPWLGARTTLVLGRSWFVSGGLGWTVPGALAGPAGAPAWRLFYAAGRSDWQAGGLFLTYEDRVALERLRDWRTPQRRTGTGVLALGVNFAY